MQVKPCYQHSQASYHDRVGLCRSGQICIESPVTDIAISNGIAAVKDTLFGTGLRHAKCTIHMSCKYHQPVRGVALCLSQEMNIQH